LTVATDFSNSNGTRIFLTTQSGLNREKVVESSNKHVFSLKKAVSDISAAKTAASNYDLVFDRSFLPLSFLSFEFQSVTGVV